MATEDESLLDEQEEEQEEQEKVQLDDDVAQDIDAKAMEKVELDLDDAPFLEDEEEESGQEEEEEPEESEPEPPEKPAGTLGKWKVIAGSALALALTSVIIAMLIFKTIAPGPEPLTYMVHTNATNQTITGLEQDEQPITISFAPFTVEYRQDGSFRFLNVRFSVVANTKVFSWEVERKMLVLRDAVYHYLMNKDLMFLTDNANAETLKGEILRVMNQYLNNGQLKSLFFETYMVM